jgi:hypothetical protein
LRIQRIGPNLIVQRDHPKPANVLVSNRKARSSYLDFGIAKLIRAGHTAEELVQPPDNQRPDALKAGAVLLTSSVRGARNSCPAVPSRARNRRLPRSACCCMCCETGQTPGGRGAGVAGKRSWRAIVESRAGARVGCGSEPRTDGPTRLNTACNRRGAPRQ